jgi:hypothetical protein
MMINILRRAKQLALEGVPVFASPALQAFLTNDITSESFFQVPKWLSYFSHLDDFDIFSAIKVWMDHPDHILALLSRSLVNRRLYKAILQQDPFSSGLVKGIREKVKKELALNEEDVNYFVIEDSVSNNAYHPTHDKIKILFKNGEVQDISAASEQLNIAVLMTTVSKNLLCFPKSIIV